MPRIDEALTRARREGVVTPPPVAANLLDTEFPAEPEAEAPAPASDAAVPAALEPSGITDSLNFRALAIADKLAPTSGNAGYVEQFRRLAARLYLAQESSQSRVVMVTSAVPGEGKTLTAANVALTLSESYHRRVLLVDADLRRPWLHEVFQLPNVAGLNDGLRAETERKVPLIKLTPYLTLLTAGRPDPDPMSVLTSDRIRRIFAEAAAAFDWVIIDTPPVALLTDAHLLASLVDTVLLVVNAGKTQLSAIKTAVQSVGRDRILGVVLNRVEQPKDRRYNNRYDYEYSHKSVGAPEAPAGSREAPPA